MGNNQCGICAVKGEAHREEREKERKNKIGQEKEGPQLRSYHLVKSYQSVSQILFRKYIN